MFKNLHLIKLSMLMMSMLLLSCSPIVRFMYGIKKPKIENEKSISNYAMKIDMSKGNIYSLSFEDYIKTLDLINKKVPEVWIFNREGNFVPYGEAWACNASAFDFIKNLSDSVNYQSQNNPSFNSLPFRLKDLNGNNVEIVLSDANYHVFIYWAKFAGKLNKDHVKVWENQALDNSKTKIKVYKVNMDFQEYWGSETLDKLVK